MGVRKTGKYGKIMVPTSEGVLVSGTQLAKSASKTIMGTAYANRFYGTSARTMWNRNKDITVVLQGVLGAVSILPGTANDKFQVSAFQYQKDGTTGPVSVAATGDTAFTRPATGKYARVMIVVDTDDNAISAVKGTDGDALSDTWDAAGGPPLVATDKIIIGGLELHGDTAAILTSAEITPLLSDGTSVQERADIPTYDILAMEGGILLSEALAACHTGGVPRKVFASFYDQASSLAVLAHTTKWALSSQRGITELPAQGDLSAQKDFSGPPSWSGSFSRYSVDSAMFSLANNIGAGVVRLYKDRNESGYFEACALFNGISLSCDQAAAIIDDVQFAVDGNIEWRDS